MDPKANFREQIELSEAILESEEKEDFLQVTPENAVRLAELVVEMDGMGL